MQRPDDDGARTIPLDRYRVAARGASLSGGKDDSAMPEPEPPEPQELDEDGDEDKEEKREAEEQLEEGLEDSFPASDPPSITQP
jgi:hypothetical protein